MSIKCKIVLKLEGRTSHLDLRNIPNKIYNRHHKKTMALFIKLKHSDSDKVSKDISMSTLRAIKKVIFPRLKSEV